MTATSALLVLVVAGDDVGSIRDTLLASSQVLECATSVAVDDGPISGLVETMIGEAEVEAVATRLATTLDPDRHLVLEAERRQIVTFERDWDVGQPSPGDRVVTVVTRKPSMTRDEFDRYWRDVHAGVALSYAAPMSGYTQYVTRRTLFGSGVEPDGVLVMSFRSAEQRRARYEDHPDDSARGAADAAVFMDLDNTKAVLMGETIWR